MDGERDGPTGSDGEALTATAPQLFSARADRSMLRLA